MLHKKKIFLYPFSLLLVAQQKQKNLHTFPACKKYLNLFRNVEYILIQNVAEKCFFYFLQVGFLVLTYLSLILQVCKQNQEFAKNQQNQSWFLQFKKKNQKLSCETFPHCFKITSVHMIISMTKCQSKKKNKLMKESGCPDMIMNKKNILK